MTLDRAEIKKKAWDNTLGLFWQLAGTILLHVVILVTLSGILGIVTAGLGDMLTPFLWGPFCFSISVVCLRKLREGKAIYSDALIPFDKKFLGKSLLLGVVSGIVTSLDAVTLVGSTIFDCFFGQIYYILYDQPEESFFGIFKKSNEMMDGYKMDYFVFKLSFIGWWLLVVFTFGLAAIWVVPYVQTAETVYYETLKDACAVKVEAIKDVNPETAENTENTENFENKAE